MSEPEGRTLEEKRDWAAEGKARWEVKMDAANAMHARAREMGGGIPGFGGGGNQLAARQVRAASDSAQRAWVEARDKLEYYTEKAKGYERRIAERDRQRLTHADIVGAAFVKTSTGWRKVVRVNAKSVSVDSGYSWVDRLTFESITDTRR